MLGRATWGTLCVCGPQYFFVFTCSRLRLRCSCGTLVQPTASPLQIFMSTRWRCDICTHSCACWNASASGPGQCMPCQHEGRLCGCVSVVLCTFSQMRENFGVPVCLPQASSVDWNLVARDTFVSSSWDASVKVRAAAPAAAAAAAAVREMQACRRVLTAGWRTGGTRSGTLHGRRRS